MLIDKYMFIGLASEAEFGCTDISINHTKSDIKAMPSYSLVRLTLADALKLFLFVLLPALRTQPSHVTYY